MPPIVPPQGIITPDGGSQHLKEGPASPSGQRTRWKGVPQRFVLWQATVPAASPSPVKRARWRIPLVLMTASTPFAGRMRSRRLARGLLVAHHLLAAGPGNHSRPARQREEAHEPRAPRPGRTRAARRARRAPRRPRAHPRSTKRSARSRPRRRRAVPARFPRSAFRARRGRWPGRRRHGRARRSSRRGTRGPSAPPRSVPRPRGRSGAASRPRPARKRASRSEDVVRRPAAR